MSAAAHESHAAQAELTASEHGARFDADAGVLTEKCKTASAARGDTDPCWTSIRNPSAEHLGHSEDYRRQAADHRAASRALRDAEASACSGISDADRDESPFAHTEDIERVEPLYSARHGKLDSRHLDGAVVTFRAVPQMTAPWLQRVIDCHIARNAALGHDVPEMAYCPLVPKGVSTTVIQTRAGFAVEIRSTESDTATEILRRAEALHGR
jgi:hypothetical protein